MIVSVTVALTGIWAMGIEGTACAGIGMGITSFVATVPISTLYTVLPAVAPFAPLFPFEVTSTVVKLVVSVFGLDCTVVVVVV